MKDLAKNSGRFIKTIARASAPLMVVLLAGWVSADPVGRYLRWRSSPVRSEPSVKKGDEKARAYYGQAFQVLETKGDWVRVRLRVVNEGKDGAAVEGWVHDTALAAASDSLGPAQKERIWLKDGGASFKKAWPENFKRVEAHAKRRRLNLRTLKGVDDLYPSEKELNDFLREGELGLYRPDWPSLVEGYEQ